MSMLFCPGVQKLIRSKANLFTYCIPYLIIVRLLKSLEFAYVLRLIHSIPSGYKLLSALLLIILLVKHGDYHSRNSHFI